ncbi:hypothetical protein OAL49_04265 [Gammaproteobacteria bacterium]|nr:hypothetical protein [Gammaproteobacteria bacterium]
MCLIARHLEASGIPTIILGSARDIVEHCGVPRFLFTDFPLGNPCGEPYDVPKQRSIVSHCFDVLEKANGPGSTVVSPIQWDNDQSWRDRYLEVRDEDRAKLRLKGEERKAERKALRVAGRVRPE